MTDEKNEEMNEATNKDSKKQVFNALVWAGAMLLASYLMRGHENAPVMLFIMLAGFFATSSVMGGERSVQAEFRCLKKKIGL